MVAFGGDVVLGFVAQCLDAGGGVQEAAMVAVDIVAHFLSFAVTSYFGKCTLKDHKVSLIKCSTGIIARSISFWTVVVKTTYWSLQQKRGCGSMW